MCNHGVRCRGNPDIFIRDKSRSIRSALHILEDGEIAIKFAAISTFFLFDLLFAEGIAQLNRDTLTKPRKKVRICYPCIWLLKNFVPNSLQALI